MGGDQHQNHAWYGVRMPAVFCRKTRADLIGFQLRTRAHESFGVEASVAQDAVTSTLSEIAFVIDFNTPPDEVPPTWKIKRCRLG